MAGNIQESLLREIDEDLRHERYMELWKRYGARVIALALAIIAVAAGFQGWRYYDLKTSHELGERFAKAQDLIREDKKAEAEAAFFAIAAGNKSGYAMLARFQNAMLKALHSGSAEGFGGLAADTSLDPLYRDLALLFSAYHESGITGSKRLIERLSPLTAEGNPWRHSALELSATLALSAGDKDAARRLFKDLADDAATPQGIRARATELLAAAGP